MKALSGHSIFLICAIGLSAAISKYTPAQTNDLPKPPAQTSEAPAGSGPGLTLSTNPAERPHREEVENTQSGDAGAPSPQSDPAKQKVADNQAAQNAGSAKPTGGKAAAQKGGEEDSGAVVVAPFPISSPALGTGLQWIAGYIFKFNKEDKLSPPSFFGTVGMYTNNGSWGVLLGGSFNFKEDRYRILTAAGDANVNFDFYGIGKVAGDRGLFLPINIQGKGFGIQPLFRIAKSLYLGPRLQYRQVNARIDTSALTDRSLPGIDRLPGDILGSIRDDLQSTRTVAIGPRLQRDTRNDTFYPVRGTILNVTGDFFLEGLGSKF